MSNRNRALLATAAAFVLLPATAFAAPNVVTSIKPLNSLVAAVMDGVGTPQLIVEGAASPHTYSLKPSNAQALQEADIVFWTGPGLEAFLEKPLEALAGKAAVSEMEEAPGVTRLPFRKGGPFEAHDHGDHHDEADGDHDHDEHRHDEHGHDDAHADHDGHDHDGEQHAEGEHHDHDHEHEHGGFDMHLWLDPENAKAMADEIEAVLAKADPDNAAAYEKNTEALKAKIDALTTEMAQTLAPVKDKPFIVFHDAYQYFEQRFGVNVAGSVTVSPETMPGAHRVTEIHEKIKELGATCVFAEPQFEPKLIQVVTEGTDAKSGVLDPLGTELSDGPELYFELIRNLATSMKACLEG